MSIDLIQIADELRGIPDSETKISVPCPVHGDLDATITLIAPDHLEPACADGCEPKVLWRGLVEQSSTLARWWAEKSKEKEEQAKARASRPEAASRMEANDQPPPRPETQEEPGYHQEDYEIPRGNDDILRRVPPQNVEAEQSFLGAILLEPSVFEEASRMVERDDFYKESHREIFGAMLAVSRRDEAIDAITLTHALREAYLLEAVGGAGYIADLAAKVPTAAHIQSYATIIRECSIKRKIGSAANALVAASFNGSTVNQLIQRVSTLVPANVLAQEETFPEPMKASQWYAREEALYSRVTWIWDNILEGGGISVLAGKKGAGKSTFVRTLMLSAARGIPLLDRNMRPSRVWYIDMEPGGSGRKALMQEMGWCDDDNLHISTGSPMAGKPGLFKWLKERIEQNLYDLVIVDTMYKLLKIEGTNDYDKGIYGQVPIEEICRATGVHFMLIHHARKNPSPGALGSIAEEILGSVSIAATAGTVMLIRKRADVSTFQMDPPRYGEAIEGEHVLKKLSGGWVESAGSWGSQWLGWAKQAVLTALKERGDAWSKAEDFDVFDMTQGKQMNVKTKKWILGKLYDDRQNTQVNRDGEGVKGSPFRYRIEPLGISSTN